MEIAGSRPGWPPIVTVGDVILITAMLAAAGFLMLRDNSASTAAARVVVEVVGVSRYDGPIDSSATITVNGALGASVIRIEGGRARIEFAPCQGQICVLRGWLYSAGDMAACVPNHVVVHMVGRQPRPYDGITQ